MAVDTNNALRAKQALEIEMKAQRMPLRLLDYFMPQLAHETAGFTSRVAKAANNLSGIKYSKNGYGKDSGIRSPEGNNYAAYASYGEWAKDFLRIIKRMGADKAQSVQEFTSLLKKGKYYTDTQSNYTNALLSWVPQMKKFISKTVDSIKENPIPVIAIAIVVIGLLFISKNN